MRAEPSHRSEMVSQALLGEPLTYLEHSDEWTKIRLAHDGYEGWILNAQLHEISEDAFRSMVDAPPTLVADGINLLIHTQAENTRLLGAGCVLPHYQDGTIQFLGDTYGFEGEIASQERTREAIIRNAYGFLHTPYIWGGRTVQGIDCSGLSQMAYRLAGITILRDASQQATQGEVVSFLEEAEPGDLLFFDNEEGNITHVGIFLSQDRVLHASGSVRIDGLDQTGIYNQDQKRHTHKLRVIKRYL